jgi:pimeloyl-ACP methyl ester carboxylesterase
MPHLVRNGLRLSYTDAGAGDPPLLLVHGGTCNQGHMLPLIGHFMRRHRVLNVDVRGHGDSDSPEGAGYSYEEINADLVWLCGELGIEKPIGIGHSYGGSTLLDLSVRQPDFLGGLVLLDTGVRSAESRLAELGTPQTRSIEEQRAFLLGRLFGADDPVDLRDRIAGEMGRTPRHVSLDISRTTVGFDAATAAEQCRIPALFLLADRPFTDPETLARLGPNWRVGKVVGAGHFIQLIVPDQVNAMIERFLELIALDRR